MCLDIQVILAVNTVKPTVDENQREQRRQNTRLENLRFGHLVDQICIKVLFKL